MKRKLLSLFVLIGISTSIWGHTYLSEGFEGHSLPTGWTYGYASGTLNWDYITGDAGSLDAHSGNFNASFYKASSDDDATKLITPEIDISDALTATLTFWHAQQDDGGLQDTLAVYYRTSSSDTWHYLGGWTNSIASWTQETFSLPSPSATYQIAFHGYEEGGYGVVVDDIEVSGTIPCPDPSNQFTTNKRLNSTRLAWTDNVSGGASSFDIELGTTGFASTGTPTQTGISNTFYTYTGLTANTGYDWYVRAVCSGGDHSYWVGANNFTTADGKAINPDPANGAINVAVTATTLDWDDVTGADGYHISVGTTSGGTEVVNNAAISGATNSAYTVSSNWSNSTTYYWTVTTDYNGSATVTGDEWNFTTRPPAHSLPLTEDFESGFSYFDNAPGNNTDFTDETSLYHGGSHSVHDSYSADNTNILHETGILDLSSTTEAYLEFWHIAKTEGGYDKCWVEISTDGGTSYTSLSVSTYQGSSNYSGTGYFHEDSYSAWGTGDETPDNTWWKKETFDLSSYNVADVRIRFKLTSDGSIQRDGWYIDDIVVNEPPCPAPGGQSEDNITLSSADLGWTSSASKWDIELGVHGFTPTGTPTQTDITANPYTYSGLSPNTSYDWYVRSNCGTGGYSNWSSVSSFTTDDGKATNPDPANGANGISLSAKTLDWDDVTNADGYHLSIGTTSGGTDIVNNAAISGASNSSYTVGSNWSYATTYYWTVTTDYDGSATVTGDEWSFTTECTSTSIPYFQAFDDVTASAFPTCMKVENNNGDSYQWETNTTHNSSPNSARIHYNGSLAMDDWFYTRGLNLTGGVTYEVNFVYKAVSAFYPEKLSVDYGTSATASAMSGSPVFDNNNITNTSWATGSGTFTPSSTGTYFVGFHGYSAKNMYILYVDDVQVVEQNSSATWNGTTDNDWTNTGNWSTSMPPGAATSITIPPGKTNYPTLTTTGYVNNFTIQSDATGTGSFIGAEYMEIAGTSTVERYIPKWSDATHGWHDMASPVTAQNISTQFVDITVSPMSSDVDLYRWSESDNMWINIKNSSGNYNQGSASTNFSNDANPQFEVGQGYLISYSSNQTKSFTGTMNTGDVPITSLSYSAASGWHLLGNPYQSALYWDKTAWGLTNIDATAKVWNESSASYTDLAAGTGIIPAMQGFMVHVNASTGLLTIDATDRTHSTTSWYKDIPVNTLKLTAIDIEGNTAQECIIRIVEDATTGFDTKYDSHFLEGFAPQFYAVSGDYKLSSDALPYICSTTEIPLSFIKNSSKRVRRNS